MNKLKVSRRVQILHMLVEGNSMRSTARVVGVSINTVVKLMVAAGEACGRFHNEHVKGITAKTIQCDEIWSFCYAKQKNLFTAKAAPKGAGDVWTWTALDADSKLIISYLVGGRDAGYAQEFMHDVRARLANRVQLTTDGHAPYLEATKAAFDDEVDYAQLVKVYGAGSAYRGHFSPPACKGVKKQTLIGDPAWRNISTSHVERANLTIRMSMRRFTRLTNGFSKKLAHHIYMLSLFFLYYNFCRKHISLKTTPAVAAGLAPVPYDLEWIVGLIDANELPPKFRGPNNKSLTIQEQTVRS